MFEARGFAAGFGSRAPAPDPEMRPTRRYTRSVEPAAFVPWGLPVAPAPPAPAPAAEAERPPEPMPPLDTIIDGDALAAAARAEGLEQGYALALDELASERAAIATLIAALEALRPEPPQALALLLAETVGRLVRQVVGEVAVDSALLARRAEAVAALVIDETAPRRLRLHPDDAARVGPLELGVELAPDAGLAPGTVLVDCGDGWIEDGPDGALDRLDALLDRLGARR